MNRRGWSVHDVVAHLTDSALTTRFGFVRQMVCTRFDFDRANEEGVAERKATDPVQTLAASRATADRTCSPPPPIATRLVEANVHGEDIRLPLGIQHAYPMEPVTMALTHMVRTSAGFGEPIACIEPAAAPPVASSTCSSPWARPRTTSSSSVPQRRSLHHQLNGVTAAATTSSGHQDPVAPPASTCATTAKRTVRRETAPARAPHRGSPRALHGAHATEGV